MKNYDLEEIGTLLKSKNEQVKRAARLEALEITLLGQEEENRILTWDNPEPKPETIVGVNGHTLCTAGNISFISGQDKTGKTAAGSSVLAGTIPSSMPALDTMGLTVKQNRKGLAVIHPDTEQSRYHADRNYRRVMSRAEVTRAPDWYKYLWLTGLSETELWEKTKLSCEIYANHFGGIHLIFIDRIADYVTDINDRGECKALINQKFIMLAQQYKCPVITALHTNPGSDKEQGHLGTYAREKCETIIRTKEENGELFLTFPRARSAPRNLPEICYEWNTEKGFFTKKYVNDQGSVEKENEIDIAGRILPSICGFGENISNAIALERMEGFTSSKVKARKSLQRFIDLGLLERDSDNMIMQKLDTPF